MKSLTILTITDPNGTIINFEWDAELHPTLFARFKYLVTEPQNYQKGTTAQLRTVYTPEENYYTDLESYMETHFMRLVEENAPFYEGVAK